MGAGTGSAALPKQPARWQAAEVPVLQVWPSVDAELAGALLGIQHAAYQVEARLIDDHRIPALSEDVDGLRAAGLLWLAAFVDDHLVGAIGWTEGAKELDIDRLVVSPDAHRRGVGSTLVRHVLQRAGKRRVVVSTGRDNGPAKDLYERLGFARTAEAQVVPGLWVTHY